jgi:superfamily II DNA or RNA helicase
MDGVRTIAGDYDREAVSRLYDTPRITGDVVAHYTRLAAGKRAVVFACTRQHARNLADAFRAAGIAATYVGGDTPTDERRAILADFRQNRLQSLCSVDILGEGLDVPGIETAILARPTRSLTLFLQQVGRALRPKPDGSRALILDHAGNSARHGLPDDDRDWVLTEDRIKRRKPPADAVRTCTACFCVYRSSLDACPACGAVPRTKPRRIKQVSGQLAEVDRLQATRHRLNEQAGAKSYGELLMLAVARGYRHPQAWARHVMASRSKRMRV